MGAVILVRVLAARGQITVTARLLHSSVSCHAPSDGRKAQLLSLVIKAPKSHTKVSVVVKLRTQVGITVSQTLPLTL